MPSTTPSVLVLTFGPLQFDSRVQRQVQSLSEHFLVTLVAPPADGPGWWGDVHQLVSIDDFKSGSNHKLAQGSFFRLVMGTLLVLRMFRLFYWSPRYHPYWARKAIVGLGESFDLIIVNDVDPLPLAFSIAGKTPVVADLHEFAPGQDTTDSAHKQAMSRYWSWLCRSYLSKCSRLTVVSESLRALYQSHFGVDSAVVRSTPDFIDIAPTQVTPGAIQFVHHGFYSPHRGIELLIEGFARARTSAVLNLVLGEAPTQQLAELASSLGLPDDKIVFHDFVPTDQLIEFLNHYDVEIIFIPTDVTNELVALPNKFFEAVQARLGIISGPTPEVVRVIEETGIGLTVESFEPSDLAKALDSVTPDQVSQWKEKTANLATHLNWQNEAPDYRDYLTSRQR